MTNVATSSSVVSVATASSAITSTACSVEHPSCSATIAAARATRADVPPLDTTRT